MKIKLSIEDFRFWLPPIMASCGIISITITNDGLRFHLSNRVYLYNTDLPRYWITKIEDTTITVEKISPSIAALLLSYDDKWHICEVNKEMVKLEGEHEDF